MYFPREEYEARWQRVHAEMARRGYDAAVVWGRTCSTFDRAGDLLYLANYVSAKVGQGFDAPPHSARAYAAVILQAGEEPELVADDPDVRAALTPMSRFSAHADPVAAVAARLRDRGLRGRIAFVGSDFFPIRYWTPFVAATPDVDWVFEDDLVRAVRLVKTPRELDCIRAGGEIATRAMTRMMDGLVAGRPEQEAAAAAAHEIVSGGGVVDRIQCSHGDAIGWSARHPLAGYGAEAPRPGDMVRAFVIGPMLEGYYFDPGRSAIAGGRPTPAQREIIEACAGIVETIAAAIRPGVGFREAAEIGDREVAAFGPDTDPAAQKFPFYGHPQGLYFEGPPYISTAFDPGDARFAAGMFIGVEAFLARDGVGNAGFEQNYIVTGDGLELLTRTPMIWH